MLCSDMCSMKWLMDMVCVFSPLLSLSLARISQEEKKKEEGRKKGGGIAEPAWYLGGRWISISSKLA